MEMFEILCAYCDKVLGHSPEPDVEAVCEECEKEFIGEVDAPKE